MLTRVCPRPSHASHRPPGPDVEKSCLRRPRAVACGEAANTARMASKQPTSVAALLQGDDESGAEPTAATDWKASRRTSAPQLTAALAGAAPADNARSSDGAITSKTSDDLPLPETPVTAMRPPAGSSTSRPLRLWTAAPRTVTPGERRRLGAWECGASLAWRCGPVREAAHDATSAGAPLTITRPPCGPAPGPISIT